MKERNHQAVFMSTLKKIDKNDKKKMAVLYLLTADGTLWNIAKKQIYDGHILLNRIRLRKANTKSYTLLCCAKDISSGTNYLTVGDLADTELISQELFNVIKRAIAIRRYGIEYNNKNRGKVYAKTNA